MPVAENTAVLPDPDAALVLAAQRGDLASAEELVRRHQADIARVLWKFARQPADLEDLVQETFLRALRGLPRWSPGRPFTHWLRRVAVNTGRDHCRREAVRGRWTGPLADDVPVEAADPRPDAAAQAALAEAKAVLAELAPDDRALLTLHHLEGQSLVEIARAFGWSVTATKVRAWRARRRLRQQLEHPTHP